MEMQSHVNNTYLREPKTAKNYFEAKRVKCIVWSYELAPDNMSAVVKYGASIFTKDDPSSIANVKYKNNVFKKSIHRETAINRYNNHPQIFTIEFKKIIKFKHEIHNKVLLNSKGEQYTKPTIVRIPYEMSRNTQTLKAIKQRMCDKINGGCSSRQNIVAV